MITDRKITMNFYIGDIVWAEGQTHYEIAIGFLPTGEAITVGLKSGTTFNRKLSEIHLFEHARYHKIPEGQENFDTSETINAPSKAVTQVVRPNFSGDSVVVENS